MDNRSCCSVRDLHHIEILCSNALNAARNFCSTFGFRSFACKSEHVAVRSGQTVFLFRERGSLYPVDTVATLCFLVGDVKEAFQRAVGAGGDVAINPSTMEDQFGRVQIAEVRTPFGNTTVRFLDLADYNGVFLPGYDDVSDCDTSGLYTYTSESGELTGGCDHVTYACHRGTLDECVQWFAASLGFERFAINPTESVEQGFVVDAAAGSAGMRLKAMDFFRCRESQLVLTADENVTSSSSSPATAGDTPLSRSERRHPLGVKLVFAEPLSHNGTNQVQLFLDEHGGAGIQHVGLVSSDIFSAISNMRQAKAEFIFIPPDFYLQCQDLVAASSIKLPEGTLSRLADSNILLDIEENVTGETRYLMQAFTKPLFSKSTFFLEVIQRVGATGFGAGNITALWRALQQHFARRLATEDGEQHQR